MINRPVFEQIYQLAQPYLNTRRNDVHIQISLQYAHELLNSEGGEESIVIPAIILHDVGWKKIPEDLHLRAFGPRATAPELNRTHEEAGVEIAADILAKVQYDTEKVSEILEIIDGHDSRKNALSLNDQIVKDADKLFRYSQKGFEIDNQRFEETFAEGINRLRKYLNRWFFTQTAFRIAKQELKEREREAGQ
ncbi:MAG: HD domain-containing protein [Desulfobacterales bacterium]|nr:HD domain-containing protein [Desulfobacterales bacterium]